MLGHDIKSGGDYIRIYTNLLYLLFLPPYTHGAAVFVIYDPLPKSPTSGRGLASTCGGNRESLV